MSRLVRAGMGDNGVNKRAKNPNFAEFLAFLGLFWIDFANLSEKDPSFGKLGHVINPLTPRAFVKNAFFGETPARTNSCKNGVD